MSLSDRAVAGLLAAISHRLESSYAERDTFGAGAYMYAAGDVRLAIAAIGPSLDPDTTAVFTDALNASWAPGGITLPPGHGDNHIDNAGHVLGACVPGDCITCHGHVSADGVFTPAQAAS